MRFCCLRRCFVNKYVLLFLFFIIQFFILYYLNSTAVSVPEFSKINKLLYRTNVSANISPDLVCVRENLHAWNAYNRTTSNYCRQRFVEAVCYRKKLKKSHHTLCPIQRLRSKSGTYLGCFHVSRTEWFPANYSLLASQGNCVEQCQTLGLPLSWIGPNRICSCHQKLPTIDTPVTDQNCQINCTLMNNSCGDLISFQVYLTWLNSPVHDFPLSVSLVSKPLIYEPVRLVFLLIWNGRSWMHIRKLFKLIYHVRHYYYIHVDVRSNYLYKQASLLAEKYSINVYLTPNRLAPIWGGQSLLNLFLRSVFELSTQMSHWKWDFIINLSESDLPVRPHHELINYLSYNRDKIFLRSFGYSSVNFLRNQGFGQLFLECDSYVWHLGTREIPFGLILDGGSDWVILPRKFVEYIVHGEDELLQNIKEYFNYSLLPVESFFHVIAQNTKFCTSVINHYLRFINWKRPQGCSCKHGTVVDWCGCSPLSFYGSNSIMRLNQLIGKNEPIHSNLLPIFFARKFDSTIDLGVVNFVISKLLHRLDEDKLSNYHLENIYSRDTDQDIDEEHKIIQLGLLCLMKQMIKKTSIFKLFDEIVPVLSNAFALFNATGWQVYNHYNSSPYELSIDQRNVVPSLILQINLPVKSIIDNNDNFRSVELLIHPPVFNYVSPKLISNLLPGEIAYVEVGSNYDVKEQLFRNYARLFTINSTITVLILWKGHDNLNQISNNTFYTSYVINLINPNNIECKNYFTWTFTQNNKSLKSLRNSNLLIETVELKSNSLWKCSTNNNYNGIWHLEIKSINGQTIYTKFLLLDSNNLLHYFYLTYPNIDQRILFQSEVWNSIYPSDYCIHTNNDKHSPYSNLPHCSNVLWSSFNYLHRNMDELSAKTGQFYEI